MKIALVGATGTVGRKVASDLARRDDVESLTLIARDGGSLERQREVLGAGVTAAVVDLGSPPHGALARATGGVDVVVNAAGPAYLYERIVADAALDAGADYASLNDDVAPYEALRIRSADAERRGITMISGAGASPGLTNLLIAKAARELESIERIDISLVSASGERTGPATELHFLDMAARPSRYVSEGRIVQDRPVAAPSFVYFPEPVGWVETFLMDHPEVGAAQAAWPAEAITFRFGLTETAAMDVVRAAVGARLLRSAFGRTAFLKLSDPTRPLLEQLPPRGAPWSSIRVDVRGRKNSRGATVTYGVVDHLANLASVMLSFVAAELGSKRIASPGFRTTDELIEPDDALRALSRRGIRFARLEPASL